jgi:formylmethanofuran dehydrogenase subunit E
MLLVFCLLVVAVSPDDMPSAIAEVRAVHGAPTHGVPGPWALLGHRIGQDAIKRFGKSRSQSWDLTVTHRAPQEVKYACMIDGLQASTGTSMGKLNLRHEAVESSASVASIVSDKKSGRTLVYKPSKDFIDSLGNADYANFPVAAKTLFDSPLERWVVVSEDSRTTRP